MELICICIVSKQGTELTSSFSKSGSSVQPNTIASMPFSFFIRFITFWKNNNVSSFIIPSSILLMNILEISVIEHLYVLLNILLFLFLYNSHLHLQISQIDTLQFSFINHLLFRSKLKHLQLYKLELTSIYNLQIIIYSSSFSSTISNPIFLYIRTA